MEHLQQYYCYLCTAFTKNNQSKMAENRNYLQRYAMQFGAYLGIYWIAGAAFFPLGMTYPLLLLLFMGFVLGGPFVGYYYARNYRNQACGGSIGFLHAWTFTVLMYVYAALLAAAAHYIYFRFIDQGFIVNTYTDMVEQFFRQDASLTGGMEAYREQMEQACEQLASLTPIDITMQLFTNNIFWGALLAIPTALFAMRKQKM